VSDPIASVASLLPAQSPILKDFAAALVIPLSLFQQMVLADERNSFPVSVRLTNCGELPFGAPTVKGMQ